jgi:hypothetical protein
MANQTTRSRDPYDSYRPRTAGGLNARELAGALLAVERDQSGVVLWAGRAIAQVLGHGRHQLSDVPTLELALHVLREGAYLRDLPGAELVRLDSGHFAVEDSLEPITAHIKRFYDDKVNGSRA